MKTATILGKPNQTLLGHITDCLAVCDEMLKRREAFLRRFCERYGWDWDEIRSYVRFAVWFHDIGKSTEEWQRYIRNEGGPVTHALVSFAIGMNSLKLNPGRFEPTAPYAALLAILAHHMQLHDGAFREDGKRRIVHLPLTFTREHSERFQHIESDLATGQWGLDQLHLARACKAIDLLKEKLEGELSFKVLYSLILNVLTASDVGSSKWLSDDGTPENPQGAFLDQDRLALVQDEFPLYQSEPLKQLPFVDEPNCMQTDVVKCPDDRLILNAGCGEGKTAAALLFAQKWMRQDRIERIILTLPTKFTANNLFRDLIDKKKYAIPTELVGITHGDSMEFLRQLPHEENGESLLAQQFENSFYAKPITISTVDHLLMSLYHGYKYADRAFFNALSSLVVFDEVHYYESTTLRAIGEAMKILTELKVPHLVMTATIPSSARHRMDRLYRSQGQFAKYPYLRAPSLIPDGSQPKQPFEIVRLNSQFFSEEVEVSQDLLRLVEQNSHLRQIIYVNQVERAKKIYNALKEMDMFDNIVCHHAGLISVHRQLKEKLIRILFNPQGKRSDSDIKDLLKHGFVNCDECVLISTQVSELSLDISADVMYSELAPVDSLVQRGGRLHRNGWSTVAPCGCARCKERDDVAGHVYRLYVAAPYEADKECLPYEKEVLDRSWEVIGGQYSFQDACKWVDIVYPESPQLIHTELDIAVKTDLVFGKRPQDNYAGDENEEGRVVLRERRYQTFEVVPWEFAERVEADYRNHKTHHVIITANAFWTLKSRGSILTRCGKLRLTNRRGERQLKEIPFLVVSAKYCFETGVQFEEEAISNIH